MRHDPLSAALEDVRASLCRGDHGALPALATKIEHLMLCLPRPDAARLRQLKRQADATADCLRAAKSGFSAARRRLEEVTAGRSALGTYDRAGARAPIAEERPATRRL